MDGLFISLLFSDPFFYLSWVVILCFSICLHELGHAWTALRLGDDTAARRGHLSLNPLAQMGVPSLVFLALAGMAWGSVPVNPARYRSARDWALVALAGPLVNLLLAILFSGLVAGADHLFPQGGALLEFAWTAAVVNALFFIYNLLPIPIFDGWTVLSWLVPAARRLDRGRAGNIAMMALLLIFLSPLGGWLWKAGYVLAGGMTAAWRQVLPG